MNHYQQYREVDIRDSLYIYNVRQIKEHIPGADGQDGVYAVTAICGSIQPEQNIGYGVSNKKFAQNIVDLYPQQDRDNYLLIHNLQFLMLVSLL